jgi:hypothetical protein
MSDYFICPHCEAKVPPGASACPHCGSDEKTGWSEEADYAHLLPDNDEGTTSSSASKPWTKSLMPVIAAAMILSFLVYILPWGIYMIPLALLGGGIYYYFTRVFSNIPGMKEQRLYRDLLKRARGDKYLVERLIEHERKRSPGSDRLKLLQADVKRWENDHKR